MVEREVDRRILDTKSLQPPLWRDEMLLTSSGVGHIHVTAPKSPEIMRTTLLPVPPVMRGEEKSTGQGYLTTNRIYHSYQPHDTVLTHPPNDRATACYRAHHNENFTYKLKERQHFRRPLTLEKQQTEHQDQYRGKPAKPLVSREFDQDLRQKEYAHHLEDGTLKRLNPTEPQADLCTSSIRPHERGVTQRMDRYATTSGLTHRLFSRKEQLELPQPNQATVYNCQRYPKSWGYATNNQVISEHKVPASFGSAMVDRATFKHRVRGIMPSYMMEPVPNCGRTIQQSSYVAPTQEEMRAPYTSTLPRLQHITAPVSFGMPVAPQMYRPLNNTYGTSPF